MFPPYPDYIWKASPNYLETKIIEVSICIGFFTFLGSDVGVRMNSTCVQLRIPSICVHLSPARYNGDLARTLEDAQITPAFNFIFLLKVC